MKYTEIFYKDTSRFEAVNPTYVDKVEAFEGIDYCKAVVSRIAEIVGLGYSIVDIVYHEQEAGND